jgi:hypothetical protein
LLDDPSRRMTLLSGSELVLVAQVPRAGDRWHQVHFNVAVGEQFFRVRPGEDLLVTIERLGTDGKVANRKSTPLVFSEKNRNYRLEFEFGSVEKYPDDGPPLLVVLELGLRYFRYVALFPWTRGYEEMTALNATLPQVGKGLRRVLTTLDEVELRWPDCPLRGREVES